MVNRLPGLLALILVLMAGNAFAQGTDARPAPAVEFLVGYAGFVDDATIDHAVIGTAARVYLTPGSPSAPSSSTCAGRIPIAISFSPVT